MQHHQAGLFRCLQSKKKQINLIYFPFNKVMIDLIQDHRPIIKMEMNCSWCNDSQRLCPCSFKLVRGPCSKISSLIFITGKCWRSHINGSDLRQIGQQSLSDVERFVLCQNSCKIVKVGHSWNCQIMINDRHKMKRSVWEVYTDVQLCRGNTAERKELVGFTLKPHLMRVQETGHMKQGSGK